MKGKVLIGIICFVLGVVAGVFGPDLIEAQTDVPDPVDAAAVETEALVEELTEVVEKAAEAAPEAKTEEPAEEKTE